MTLPPLNGAVHDTLADPLPGVAVTPVGAPGAAGGPVPDSETSSRYIAVLSDVADPSPRTLNHRTMVCPAYGVVSNSTWVQACVLVLDRKICASVWPCVSRIWASFQSATQSATLVHRVSVERVQYQKPSC